MSKVNKAKTDFEVETKKLEQFGFQKFGSFTPEDVFIVGYPKSGNTLLQHLVTHLVFGLRKDTSKSLINSCVTEFYNNPYFFRHNNRHFFKSHELPRIEYQNVIYIVRDGRDAIRSYYFMLQNLGQSVSLEELYTSGGDIFVGTWGEHIKQWNENPFNANILFVRYEDLLSDKKKEILRICNFLKLDLSENEIHDALEATTLDNMKKMENTFSWKRSKSFKTWLKSGRFVREGKAQGYKNDKLIQEDWIRQFEEVSKEMLLKFEYLD